MFPMLLVPWALLVHRYWFLCDDAFISFRYAKHWAEGYGPRYNITGNEVPVEGYSNFLWMAVSAAVHRAGGDMAVVMPWLSVLCAAALLGLVYRTLLVHLKVELPLAWATTLIVACFPPFAVWSTSGLETMSEALFLFSTWWLLALGRSESAAPLLAGGMGLLLSLSRPEGVAWAVVVAGVAGLQRVLERRPVVKPLALYFGLLVPFYGAYFAWRYQYYHALTANTAYAKVHMDKTTFVRGFQYLAAYIATVGSPILLAPALPFSLRDERKPLAVSAGLMAVAIPAYAVVISGDYMTYFRVMVPGVAFMALSFALALKAFEKRSPTAVPLTAVLIAGMGMLPALNLYMTPPRLRERLDIREKLPIFRTENEQWQAMVDHTEAWADKGKALASYADPGETYVAAAIGNVGYYSELFIYDRNGLVTREVAMIPWNGELRSPGHDKTVEPDFFLPLKPDILDSKLVYGPRVKEKVRLAMREMEASRYKDMYYPDVTFLEPNPAYRAQRVLVALRRGDTPLDCAQRWAAYREHMKDVPENPVVEPTGIE